MERDSHPSESLIARHTTLETDSSIVFTFQRYEIQSNMQDVLEISWFNEAAN